MLHKKGFTYDKNHDKASVESEDVNVRHKVLAPVIPGVRLVADIDCALEVLPVLCIVVLIYLSFFRVCEL